MNYQNDSELVQKQKHRLYEIKTGDSLESVAADLGFDPQEVRHYHNTYCELADLIEANFKSHLKYLLLPIPSRYDAKNKFSVNPLQKVIFAKNYKLPFLAKKVEKSYKVQITTQTDHLSDVLLFSISVCPLATDINGFHLIAINRKSDFEINGKTPSTVIHSLDAKTAETLYPLKIVVDSNGKWIDIYNYQEIINRWKKTKKEILEYYEGAVVNAHIELAEYALENKQTLLRALQSDYFLKLFFNGIHVGYTQSLCIQRKISFPIEKNKDAVYNVEQKVMPFLQELDLIKVEIVGDLVDVDFNPKFATSSNKGSYSATYLLNDEDYGVEKLTFECSIIGDEVIKVKVDISPLEFDPIY